MTSQLNSQAGSLTKPQGSPYCADPNCESCKDLREIQERIRSENVAPKINSQPSEPAPTAVFGKSAGYRR